MIISKENYKIDSKEAGFSKRNNIYKMFEITQEYSGINHDKDDLPKMLGESLGIFLEFPYISTASVFLLDENDFGFKHRKTLPHDNQERIIDIYADMVESGIIGAAIDSNNFSVFPEIKDVEDEDSPYYLVFSLTNSETCFGLLILESKLSPHEIEQGIIKLLKIVINIFKLKLNNSLLNMEKNQTAKYLNQLASEKAIKSVNSEFRHSGK